MQFRRLGNTDIEVSTICQGCWSIVGGGTWGEQDRDQSVRTLRAALDAGINFFDTAPQYGDGESEQLVGRALADVRGRAVIATKVNREDLAPELLIASCERSLRMLQTDYVDLLQIHWPNPDVPLADSIAAMLRLKEQGKVRAIGASNLGPAYMRDAFAAGGIVSNQLCYSLLFRAVEYEIQPLCVEHGVGILCYSPLCQGLLTGKFGKPQDVPDGRARTRLFSPRRPLSRHKERGCEQELFEAIGTIRGVCEGLGQPMGHVAIAWLLAQGAVASVIAGARSPEQARDNAAASGLKLPPDAIEALSSATEWLKQYVGANADPWQSNSRLEK